MSEPASPRDDLADALVALGAEVVSVVELPAVPAATWRLASTESVRVEFRLAGGVHSVRSHAPRPGGGGDRSLVLSGHDSVRGPDGLDLTLFCDDGPHTYVRDPGGDAASGFVLGVVADHLATAHEGSSTRCVRSSVLTRFVAAVRLDHPDGWPSSGASDPSASGAHEVLAALDRALSLLEGVSEESYALAAGFLEDRAAGAPVEWLLRRADARVAPR